MIIFLCRYGPGQAAAAAALTTTRIPVISPFYMLDPPDLSALPAPVGNSQHQAQVGNQNVDYISHLRTAYNFYLYLS